MNCTNVLKLIAIPLAFVVVNLRYLSVLFPVFSAPPGYDQDPAYAYLFNGLLLIDGQGPWQVDHPGTPLQLLCAVIILFARALFSMAGHPMSPDLVDDVLADPEPYLYVASCVLIALNACALYYLGSRVWRATGSHVLACLCQAGGLAFSIVSPRAAYVAPEALLIFATLCLVGQLAPVVFAVGGGGDAGTAAAGPERGRARWVGIICGFGLAVKVTFLPLVGLALMVRPVRNLLIVAGYAVASLIVLLLPTLRNYERFFSWIWNVASHSGIHGSGRATVIDPSQLIGNFATLFTWYPGFFLVMGALLVYIPFAVFCNRASREALPPMPLRFPLVVLLVASVQSVLVLKHPGAHYMVSVLPMSFIGLAWLLFQFELRMRQGKPAGAYRGRVLVAGIAICYGLYCVAPTIRQIDKMRVQRAAQDEALAMIGARTQQYPDALVICAFRCTMPKYGTALGLMYALGLANRPIVSDLLADYYEYNFLVREFIAPGQKTMTLDDMSREIARGRRVFLVTPKDYPDLAVFDLKKVLSTDPLTLYEVTGIRSGSSD